jgi:hypothetical protein
MVSMQNILNSGGPGHPELLSKITYSLETLYMMQKERDWVAFADVLEFEFIPLWKTMVSSQTRS